jgi:hypothetical protein
MFRGTRSAVLLLLQDSTVQFYCGWDDRMDGYEYWRMYVHTELRSIPYACPLVPEPKPRTSYRSRVAANQSARAPIVVRRLISGGEHERALPVHRQPTKNKRRPYVARGAQRSVWMEAEKRSTVARHRIVVVASASQKTKQKRVLPPAAN